MSTFLIIVATSFIFSWVIIILSKRKYSALNDQLPDHTKKNQSSSVPRLGGLAIFVSFSMGCWLSECPTILKILYFSSLPAFLIGLIEDVTAKISPLVRLSFIFIATTLVIILANLKIDQVGFSTLDALLVKSIFLSTVLTLLVVGGTVNAFNIIDGANGLMPGFALLVLSAIIFVANILNDTLIVQLCLLLAGSILGFFLLNFPLGRIFSGDGGAYFIGFMLTNIALLFTSRHQQLSNWFILSLLIYPLFETAFSMYRRVIKNVLIATADQLHLHTLIYKRLVCRQYQNHIIRKSATTIFLWFLSLTSIIPAVIWHNNPTLLFACPFLFVILYIVIYCRIIYFKF